MKKIIFTLFLLAFIGSSFYLLNRFIDQQYSLEPGGESEGEGVVEKEVGTEILQEGTGEGAENGDSLTVHYTGMFEDGTEFESSLDAGNPIVFTLGAGNVIQGWEKGLLGVKVGEKRKLTISPELAYGETGDSSGKIPPNSTLIFEIEVLEINK